MNLSWQVALAMLLTCVSKSVGSPDKYQKQLLIDACSGKNACSRCSVPYLNCADQQDCPQLNGTCLSPVGEPEEMICHLLCIYSCPPRRNQTCGSPDNTVFLEKDQMIALGLLENEVPDNHDAKEEDDGAEQSHLSIYMMHDIPAGVILLCVIVFALLVIMLPVLVLRKRFASPEEISSLKASRQDVIPEAIGSPQTASLDVTNQTSTPSPLSDELPVQRPAGQSIV